MPIKICVVTGSRAEWGLLEKVVKVLDVDRYFDPMVFATGNHRSDKFGRTVDNIKHFFMVPVGPEIFDDSVGSIISAVLLFSTTSCIHGTSKTIIGT